MLYLLRHGQTDWNIDFRLQGTTDIPLNATGLAMAREAHDRYQDIPLDICFVSPLSRAVQTAELVLAGRDIPMVTDERLHELDFGSFDGMRRADAPEGHPVYTLFHTPERYVAEGGAEPLESLYARTGAFLADRVAPLQAEGKDILIVAHGAVNRAIINRVRGIPLARFWETRLDNCTMVALE